MSKTYVEESEDIIVIFSMKKAQHIIRAGYDLRGVRNDNKNPSRKVFLFKNEPGIIDILHSSL